MNDGKREPGANIGQHDVEAAENRYDAASLKNREVAWLELWRAWDFTWQGRSEKAALQTVMVQVPASFPDGREAEGEFKTISLKDYWRWSVGLAGDERLLTDEELREAGLLVEVKGKIYHLIHAPDMGLKLDEQGALRQVLADIIAARVKCVPADIGTDAEGQPNSAHALQLGGAWLPGEVLRHTGIETAVRLSGARVSDVSLAGLKVGHLDCTRSYFAGDAYFRRATFSGKVNFRRATFIAEANFSHVTFTGKADFSHVAFEHACFRRATFMSEAYFGGATFSGTVSITRFGWQETLYTIVSGGADFRRANFNGSASFPHTKFGGEADFESASFGGRARFAGTSFTGEANFGKVTFSDEAGFWDATFHSEAGFVHTTFRGRAALRSATFRRQALFESAIFSEKANFESAAFGSEANFRSATFARKANFFQVTFSDSVCFSDASFTHGAYFLGITFNGKADFESTGFGGRARFAGANFIGEANFGKVTFSNEAGFWHATFQQKAGFGHAIFRGVAGFRGATFCRQALFGGATFSGRASFVRANLSKRLTFENATFERVASFRHVNWSTTNSPNAFKDTHFKDHADFQADEAFAAVPWWRRSVRDCSIQVSAFNEAHFKIPPNLTNSIRGQEDDIFCKSIRQTNKSVRQAKKKQAEARRKGEEYEGPTPDRLWAALEGGFRTLKKAAESRGDFLLAHTYYRFEMRTRVRRPEMPFWEKVAAAFYGLSSDYGNSIARPFVSLAVILAGFAVIYLGLSIEVNLIDSHDKAALQSGFFESLDFSLKNVFRPLSALSTDAPREGDAGSLAGKLLNNHGKGFGLIVSAISIVQSLTGIVLAFMFGLAVRRRFKVS